MSSSFTALWGWPIALGLLIASGLLAALLFGDWGDRWSWVALAVPVVVMIRYGRRRPDPRRARTSTAPTAR